MTDQLGDWFAINQHMDSNLGIWVVESLSSYASKLESHGYKNLKFSFKYEEKTYYSILTQACPGYFVELISDSQGELGAEHFNLVSEPRAVFPQGSPSYTSDTVIKVSRATTRIDEMIDFYVNVIGGSTVQPKTTAEDGTEWAVVKLTYADAHLHFVNRPASEGQTFTVADLEDYMNSVHDKYVKSTNCGFD